MKKLIAATALFFACWRLPAAGVGASVFTNCATVCINREIQVPDCSFPDISGLNAQLASLQADTKKLSEDNTKCQEDFKSARESMLTVEQCDARIKVATIVPTTPAAPAAAAPATPAPTPAPEATTTTAQASPPAAAPDAAKLRECASAKLVYMGLMNKKTITAGTSVKCDNATFGDSVKTKVKKCYIDGVAKADENGGFSMEFDGMVAYGLITQLDYSGTGTTALECTNTRFENKDPIPGTPKKCYDSKGNELADEGKTFTPPNPKPAGC